MKIFSSINQTKLLLQLCLMLVFSTQCIHVKAQPSSNAAQQSDQVAAFAANGKLTYKIIDAPNKTLGYDIYNNNQLLIHQPCIPGAPGNNGFTNKSDAGKVAQLVVEKIKKGNWPPTITIREMQQLKVFN